jgi:hypothetical protein
MRSITRALLGATLLAATILPAGTAQADVAGNTQGCTPGYWKVSQHWDSWQESSPTDLFSTMFGTSNTLSGIAKFTMVGALAGKGGTGVDGARQILARAAAAAYLNASYDAPDGSAMLYPYRRSTPNTVGGVTYPALVPTVRTLLTGTNRAAMLDFAAKLDKANNLGCPLS